MKEYFYELCDGFDYRVPWSFQTSFMKAILSLFREVLKRSRKRS